MAASISTLSILLTGSAAGLVSAFAQGKHSANEFGEGISEVGSRVGEVFAGLGIAIGGEEIVGWLKEAAGRVGDISLKSKELGESTEAFTRLSFAAKETGVGMEALTTSTAKMENNLEKAVQGAKSQSEAFERLGLNANELKNLSPDQQFNKIADAIAKLKSPTERINAEMAIFGKTGAQLGPLLDQGSAGIEKMGEEADKLGVTLNDVDAAKVLEANQAISQLQDVTEGVGNQILVQLAPIITDVSSRLKMWLEDGNVIKSGLDAVWKGIGFGAGFVVDVLKLGEAGFDAFASVGYAHVYVVVQAFDEFAKVGLWVWNKVFGTHIDTSGIDELSNTLKNKTIELAQSAKDNAVDALITGSSAAKVMKYFDDVTAAANKRAKPAAPAGQIHEQQIEKHAKKSKSLLDELAKAAEAGWKKISSVIDTAAKKMEEASKKLGEEAKNLLNEFATPLEKEQQKIAEVEKLFAAGKLSQSQKDTLEQRIKADFEKDVNIAPKAALAGTQESFNLINEIQKRVSGAGKDSVPEKHLAESQKQTTLLQKIAGTGPRPTLKLQLATI